MGIPDTAAVVVAAGRGRRLHGGSDGQPKALLNVAGRPLLAHALGNLDAVEAVGNVIVVHTPGWEERFRKVAGRAARLVAGGSSRKASVRAGVAAVPRDVQRVAIHDAARGLTPPAVIERAVTAVSDDVIAAAPGWPVRDTLKRVGDARRVVETVDRSGLWAVHTPQVARYETLSAVLEWAGGQRRFPLGLTDDLGLIEAAVAAGVVTGRIVVVDGDARDLKVTYPQDLDVAAALASAADASGTRGDGVVGR